MYRRSEGWDGSKPETKAWTLFIQHNCWKSQALHFLCHTITVNCCLKRGHQLPQYKCLFCSRYHVVIQLCNDSFRICRSKHWVPVIIFPGRKSSSHTGSILFYVCRSINRCLFGIIMRWTAYLVRARMTTIKTRKNPSFFNYKKSNIEIKKILGKENQPLNTYKTRVNTAWVV